MGKRTSYTHGTFSWVDNATTDQEGAKAFYSRLFGWEIEDRPAGEGVVYSMALKDGQPVAAIGPQQPDEIQQDIPPHWNHYVTVDDVDATSERVTELGGQLVVPPFDVMTVGRMSVLVDPTGGVLCLWEPRDMPGAAVVNEPGALCWNQLNTRDPETAMRFYGDLFGWTFERVPGAPMEIWTIFNNGGLNGNVVPMGDEWPERVPSHWLAYFGVESIDATTEKIEGIPGAVVMVPKTAAGHGNQFAVLHDPYRAMFAIFEGHFDD